MTAGLVALHQGPKGIVAFYIRPNGRSPADEFLAEAPAHLLTRFHRSFNQFGTTGWNSASAGSLKPLNGEAKGLWAFKEHDQRLFAVRGPDYAGKEVAILLGGWVKDRDTHVEERKVYERIQGLWMECQEVVDLKNITVVSADMLVKLRKKFQPEAPAVAAEPAPKPAEQPPELPAAEKPKKIPSRSELLEMATLVVDGKAEGLEFLTLVEDYQNHRTAVETEVARLREEAARLAAVEAELDRLRG